MNGKYLVRPRQHLKVEVHVLIGRKIMQGTMSEREEPYLSLRVTTEKLQTSKPFNR